MKSKILNPKRMKQLIDFKGLELDNGIYPTDIDGLIEYHDSEYILLEVKHKDARVPYGQRLAIQRMVDDFTKAGRRQLQLFVNTKWMIQTSLWLRHFARSESCTTAANTSGDRQIRQ